MEKIFEAVSVDIEGCATELGGGRVPWPTQKLAKLSPFLNLVGKVMGIRFFLNTGRQAPYTEAVLQALGLITNTPSIFENGVGLYWPDTRKWKLNPAITKEKEIVFQKIEKDLIGIMVELGGVQELGKKWSFSTNPPSGMRVEKYFMLIQEMLLKKEAMAEIEVTHSQSAVDVTIEGVNKQTGLNFWCQETGIKLEELAGIGDSRGDSLVLEVVGMPMCPSNSTSDIKELVSKRGGYVSPHQTVLGVMDCVAHLTGHPFIIETSNQIIRQFLLRHPIELYGI